MDAVLVGSETAVVQFRETYKEKGSEDVHELRTILVLEYKDGLIQHMRRYLDR